MTARRHIPSQIPNHVHNCLLIRRWWRLRWVCIRCNTYSPEDRTGQPSAATTGGTGEAS